MTARVACAALGDPRLVLGGDVLGLIVDARGDGFIAERRWHVRNASGGGVFSRTREVRVVIGEPIQAATSGIEPAGDMPAGFFRARARRRRIGREMWRRVRRRADAVALLSSAHRIVVPNPEIDPLGLSRTVQRICT